jgi:hypothetical protein
VSRDELKNKRKVEKIDMSTIEQILKSKNKPKEKLIFWQKRLKRIEFPLRN